MHLAQKLIFKGERPLILIFAKQACNVPKAVKLTEKIHAGALLVSAIVKAVLRKVSK